MRFDGVDEALVAESAEAFLLCAPGRRRDEAGSDAAHSAPAAAELVAAGCVPASRRFSSIRMIWFSFEFRSSWVQSMFCVCIPGEYERTATFYLNDIGFRCYYP